MNITDLLGMISGLALFLYGMHMMSEGLNEIAGNRMKDILEHLTNRKLKAIMTGTIVTSFIQSSSALSIMLIGFMNASLLPLKNAIWTLMGADIGTTITGQIIAFRIGIIAPFFAIIGVIMIVFIKSKLINHLGEVIGGLGILFIGLEIMSTAMKPLQSEPYFMNFISSLQHPGIAVIFGMIFTALIQSSSASIGILQMMVLNGFIKFRVGAFVVFGQNIGTCITSLLASLSSCRNAKRLTVFHILFNSIGAFIFTMICLYTPLLSLIELYSSSDIRAIANLHTIFNIFTVIIFLPFDDLVINLIYKIFPIKVEEKNNESII